MTPKLSEYKSDPLVRIRNIRMQIRVIRVAYMYTQLHESISVMARFEKNKVIPLNFQWGGRVYDNLRLNLVYKERRGRVTLTYFCVDDGVNYFKLSFNGETLAWLLEETG